MKKLLILITASLVLAAGLWADDSFFTSGFEDSESEDFGFGDSAFGDSAFGDESPTAVEINGGVTTSVRAFASEDAREDMADRGAGLDQMETSTAANLGFTYEGSNFKVVSDFDVTPEMAGSERDSMVTVNEAYGQYFGEKMNFEAGYMKVVWGKADEFHVVDVLNSVNLSEFLIPDYMEMIDPELMLKVNVPLGMSGMLELAYVPTLTPYSYAESGIWQPLNTKDELPATLQAIASQTAAAIYAQTGSVITPNITALAGSNTNTFDYGQGALHYTSTAGGLDYGFTYYYGYNKLPSFNYAFDGVDTINYWFEYDPMQTFGVEAAYILAGFNMKGEFAYNMTEDFDGDKTDVHNNSIKWVAGFDRDIPVSNLNINIQEAGTLTLNSNEIELGDIEYNEDEEYTENLLIFAVSDKYLHEKLEAELITFYHFEDSDYGIYPSIEYSPVDDFTLGMAARFFGGDEDTLFGQYDENDFVELTVSYSF